jgi:FkbM family methyltransferase
VLFGAGGRGRRISRILRSAGIEPLAFADNQEAVQGTTVEGIRVLSPIEAARQHSDAVFVVTIWSDQIGHPFDAVHAQLNTLGVHRVASFTALYETLPDLFFPDFFLDRKDSLNGASQAIAKAASLWTDDFSVREFAAQLELRIGLDLRVISGGCSYPAYFPSDLFRFGPEEVFVDCGAYDGDTYLDFKAVTSGNFSRYIALEPDEASFLKLTARASADLFGPAPRARLLKLGAGEREEVIRFSADGSTESRIDAAGSIEIRCAPLDTILRDEAPTYLKMDIEGAEAAALRGARATILRHRPILAVSAYHRVSDLWELPLLIDSLAPDYAFFLRPEKKAGWDLICYAVPRDRLHTTR